MGRFIELYKGMGVLLIVGCVLFVQYKKIHDFEYRTMGYTQTTLKRKVWGAIGMGILGGILGTTVILLLGITVKIGDFTYLLPVAILLMMVNARYMCFAYGGSLLGIVALLLGNTRMNVPGLMAIVGVLHLVESILIWLDGHQHATPIFLEDENHGIIGGFILQRFWPIPLILMLMMIGTLEGAGIPLQASMVVAALGYSDITLSSTPRKKSQISALRLLVYSLILIFLAMMANKYSLFQWITVIFGPLGHEILILWSQKEEKKKVPLFRQHSRGVTVLDVKKDCQGKQIDVHPGDIILRMNRQPIDRKEDIQRILYNTPKDIRIEVIDGEGKHRIIDYKSAHGIRHLGLVIVPETSAVVFEPNLSFSLAKKWMEKIKNYK